MKNLKTSDLSDLLEMADDVNQFNEGLVSDIESVIKETRKKLTQRKESSNFKRGFITKDVESYLKILNQGRDSIAKQLEEDHLHWLKDYK